MSLLKKKFFLIFWIISLWTFICTIASGKSFDHGYISFALAEKNIRIPVEEVYYDHAYDITLRAFCRITEPTRMTMILTLVIHNSSSDPDDIDIKNCWLSLEQKNDNSDDFYLSFGFNDSLAFYSTQKESKSDVRKVRTEKTELMISKFEQRSNYIVVAGDFASRHLDKRNGNANSIDIRNGHFSLLAAEDEIPPAIADVYSTVPTIEDQAPTSADDVSVSASENTLLTTYHPSLSPSVIFPSSEDAQPDPNQIEALPDNPASNTALQQRTRYRTNSTGRGSAAAIPQKAYRESSSVRRGNQQESDTSRTRNTGIRRGRP
jgi:hypothetical protein